MGDYGQYDIPTPEELINFKIGQPATSMLPLDMLRECANIKFAETDPMYLQYGHLKGYPKFRKSLAKFLTEKYGYTIDPEELLITNGVTGGISLVASLFLRSGDLVFMEEPTYFLALSIMKDFKINVRQIPMEQDGINVDILEELLESGIRPKALYTVPTCHNPTGRTMSVAKRKKLIELSVKYDFIIIADEVYQLLSFPGVTPPPNMFSFDKHGTVLALGSFSKILAPSLRLGWIQAKEKLMNVITGCGQLDSSGGINPVIQGIVHAAIDHGHQEKFLTETKQTLGTRADTLMKALKKNLPPYVTFEVPDGGYFILVKLPENMNAGDMLPIATKHKVQYLPGGGFAKSMGNYLRLSFSCYDLPHLELGTQRLAAAIEEYAKTLESASGNAATTASAGPVNTTKVALHGATGRLGSLIATQLDSNDKVEYVGAIDRNQSNIDVLKAADVIIDVTLPQGTAALVKALETAGVSPALVIGTTGDDLPLDALAAYGTKAPVIVKSNFSVGVPLLATVAGEIAQSVPSDWNVSVSETHHTKKLDAPSGTAKTLVKSIKSVGPALLDEIDETVISSTNTGDIQVTSLRLGDEFGKHTVSFAGQGERIEITHQATRREVFAIGAVRTALEAINHGNGLSIE